MSWVDVAKGAAGKVLAAGASLLSGDRGDGGTTEGGGGGGGAGGGDGGGGGAGAGRPASPPPAPRPVVLVDVVLVAVVKRDALASGGVRLRAVGSAGLEGDPVPARPLPGSSAAHCVVEFTARAPADARQLRFTFVGGEGDGARERKDDRSTFVRVVDLSQPAAAPGVHAFLGLLDLEGDTPLGLRDALAAYARHALLAHLQHQQPLRVPERLGRWRAIVSSLAEEKEKQRHGKQSVLLGGPRQRARVNGAASVAVEDLVREVAKSGEALHVTRAAFLLLMLCPAVGYSTETAVRALGRQTQELFAQCLVPPSAAAAEQLLRDLSIDRVDQRLLGILRALLAVLEPSDSMAWLRLVPLLCHAASAVERRAWAMDPAIASRIRRHVRTALDGDVKMAQICEAEAEALSVVAPAGGGCVFQTILRCSSLKSLASGTFELCVHRLEGGAAVAVCNHLRDALPEDGDVEVACLVIAKLEALVVAEGCGDSGAAAARLIQGIMGTDFRGPSGTETKRLRVAAVALAMLHRMKPAAKALSVARTAISTCLRRCFEHASLYRRSLHIPAQLYEILLPSANEADVRAFVKPLEDQLRVMPATQMIDLFPSLLENSQQVISDMATDHAMQAITVISRDAREQGGLFSRLTSIFSAPSQLSQIARALSVLFQTGCPQPAAAGDFHTAVTNVLTWAMWPTFFSLPDNVQGRLSPAVRNRLAQARSLVGELVGKIGARDISVRTATMLAHNQDELRRVLEICDAAAIDQTIGAIQVAQHHVDAFALEHAHVVSFCGLCDVAQVGGMDEVRRLVQRNRGEVHLAEACDAQGACIFFQGAVPPEIAGVLHATHSLGSAQTFIDGSWGHSAREWQRQNGNAKPLLQNTREIFDAAFQRWQQLAHDIESGGASLASVDEWFGRVPDGKPMETELALLARTAHVFEEQVEAQVEPAWVSERAKQVALSHDLTRLKDYAGPVVMAARALGLNIEDDHAFKGFAALAEDGSDFGQMALSSMTEAVLSNVSALGMFQSTEIEALKAIAAVCDRAEGTTTLLDFLRKDDIAGDERFAEFERLATAQAQSARETTIITLLAKTRTALFPALRLAQAGDIQFYDFLAACQPALSAPELSQAIGFCAQQLYWLEERLRTASSTVSTAAREELQRVVDSGEFCVRVGRDERAITNDRIEKERGIACVRFKVMDGQGEHTESKEKSLEMMRSMQAKLTLLGDEDDAEDVKERVEYLSQWNDALRKLAQTASRAKAACLPLFDQDFEETIRFSDGAPQGLRDREAQLASELHAWGENVLGHREQIRSLNYFDTFSLKAIHRCVVECLRSPDDALSPELVRFLRCIDDDFDHGVLRHTINLLGFQVDDEFAGALEKLGQLLECVYEQRAPEPGVSECGLQLRAISCIVEQRPLAVQRLLMTLHSRANTRPSFENTLACTELTSADEVLRLILRATVANRPTFPGQSFSLFALLNVDRLPIVAQRQSLERLTEEAQRSGKWRRTSCLAVIAAKDCHLTRGLASKLNHAALTFELASEDEMRQFLFEKVLRKPAPSQHAAALPPQAAAPPLGDDVTDWACTQCTFVNDAERAICELCDSGANPQLGVVAAVQLQPPPAADAVDFDVLGRLQRIQVVENDRASGSGVGKSVFIRSQACLVAQSCGGVAIEDVYRWMPLNGKVDAHALARMLADNSAVVSPLPRLLHINLGADIEGDVDTILFNFCVLGVACDESGQPYHRQTTDMVAIELAHPPHAASCEAGDEVGNDARRFAMYGVFPSMIVPGPKLLFAQEGRPLGYTIDPRVYDDHRFQRVCHHLQQMNANMDAAPYDDGDGDGALRQANLPERRCMELLLEYCPRRCTQDLESESWITLSSFWQFLADMLEQLDCNCGFADFIGFDTGVKFRPFAVEFLVNASRDFCASNLNAEALARYRPDAVGAAAAAAGFDAVELSNPQARWEESIHPYMVFNRDGMGTFSFFGFRIGDDGWVLPDGDDPLWMWDANEPWMPHRKMEAYDAASSQLIEAGYTAWSRGQGPSEMPVVVAQSGGTTYNILFESMQQRLPTGTCRAICRIMRGPRDKLPASLRRPIMHPELRKELGGMMDMTGGSEWPRAERLTLLFRVLGFGQRVDELGSPPDPSPSYILTDDNMKKILAVLLRFSCKQPAVIMGETGCGKTAMVHFIARLIDPSCWDPEHPHFSARDHQRLLFKELRVDGGTDATVIRKHVQEAVDTARDLKETGTSGTVLVFADEVNACREMSMFQDLFCDRRMFGACPVGALEDLPIRLIAACNPYKKHSADMIERLEQAGLGFKEQHHLERGVGGVPMRQLVYRVSPLPQSLEQLVFDFGTLDSQVEKAYVASIVGRRLGASSDVRAAQDGEDIPDIPDGAPDKEVHVMLLPVGQHTVPTTVAEEASSSIVLKGGDTWEDVQTKIKRRLQIFVGEYDDFSRLYAVLHLASGQPVKDFGAIEAGAVLVVKNVIDGLDESQAKQLTDILVCCQAFMRERTDECSFVSLRDVERAVSVFQFFWARRMRERVCSSLIPVAEVQAEGQEEGQDWRCDAFAMACIVAVAVCYRCKLTEGAFADFDSRVTATGRAWASAAVIGKELKRVQTLFADNLVVEDASIAKNHALSENAFVMIICIELRIPLTLIGKPGSSKSLAKLIIKNNLQGPLNGRTPDFYKPFKEVAYMEYLCSPHSTAEAIEEVVKLARAMQDERSGQPYAAVVVLDEVGLAEDSVHLPLKVLHRLLDDGDVSFVGISNWALDPAKMNRGLFLNRGAPTQEELKYTAKQMISTGTPPVALPHMATAINGLANAYHEVAQEHQPREQREFFGLRDFYLVVKHLNSIALESNRRLCASDLEYSIRRNFGGAGNVEDILGVFQAKLGLEDGGAAAEGAFDAQPNHRGDPTLELVARAMDPGQKMDGRFVLALTRSDTQMALDVLFSEGERGTCVLPEASTDVIFGSSFPKDQDFSKACRDVSKVKMCMSTGRTVVLMDADYIHESLYDLLNQYYVTGMGRNYAQIGLGKERDLCAVDDRFRLMVLASSEHALQAFPIPLLNRFEKHEVTLQRLLTPGQQAVREKMAAWARTFSTPLARLHARQSESQCLVGFNDETTTSLALSMAEGGADAAVEVGVARLLRIATADAVARAMPRMQGIADRYFAEDRTLEPLFVRMVRDASARQAGDSSVQPDCIVTTFSVMQPPSDLKTSAGVEVLVLHEYDVEHEFVASCEERMRNLGTQLLCIVCSLRHLRGNAKLVGFARYLLDNMKSRRDRKDVAVCILLHLERSVPALRRGGDGAAGQQVQASSKLVIPFSPKWGVAHIDSLVPPAQFLPQFSRLLLDPRPLSECMAAGAVDLRALLLLSAQPALARLRPTLGDTPLDLHGTKLIEGIRDLFQPRVDTAVPSAGLNAKLGRVIERRVLALIRGREAQSANPAGWISQLMGDADAVTQCGTALKVVEVHVERWVSQALALVLGQVLKHGGLLAMLSPAPLATCAETACEFALLVLDSEGLVPLGVERAPNGVGFTNDCAIEQQVTVDASVTAQLPLSWALYSACSALRVAAEERSATESLAPSRCLRALLEEKLLAAFAQQQPGHDGAIDNAEPGASESKVSDDAVGVTARDEAELKMRSCLSSLQLVQAGPKGEGGALGGLLLQDMLQMTRVPGARRGAADKECDDASAAVQTAAVLWYSTQACAEEGEVARGVLSIEHFCVGLWRAFPLLSHLLDFFEAGGKFLIQRVHRHLLAHPLGPDDDAAACLDAVCRAQALEMLEPQTSSVDDLKRWMHDVNELRWALQQPFAPSSDLSTADETASAGPALASAAAWNKLDLTRQVVQSLCAESFVPHSQAQLDQIPRHLWPRAAVDCAKMFWGELKGDEVQAGSRECLELLLRFLRDYCKRIADAGLQQLEDGGTKVFGLFEPCPVCMDLPQEVRVFNNAEGKTCGHVLCSDCAAGIHECPTCQGSGGFTQASEMPGVTQLFEALGALRRRCTALFVAVAQRACEAAVATPQEQSTAVFELLADVLTDESPYFGSEDDDSALLKLKKLCEEERLKLLRSFMRPLARTVLLLAGSDVGDSGGSAGERLRGSVEQLLNERVLVRRAGEGGGDALHSTMRTFVEHTEDELHALPLATGTNDQPPETLVDRAVKLLCGVRGARQDRVLPAGSMNLTLELQQLAVVRFALCAAAPLLEEQALGGEALLGSAAALVCEVTRIAAGSPDAADAMAPFSARYSGTELRLVRLFLLKQVTRRSGGGGFDRALLCAIGRGGGGAAAPSMPWVLDEVSRGASEQPDYTLCLVRASDGDEQHDAGSYGAVRKAVLDLEERESVGPMLEAVNSGGWRFLLLLLATGRGYPALFRAIAQATNAEQDVGAVAPAAGGAADDQGGGSCAEAGDGLAKLLRERTPPLGLAALASVAAGGTEGDGHGSGALLQSARDGGKVVGERARGLLYGCGYVGEDAVMSAGQSRLSALLAHFYGLLVSDATARSPLLAPFATLLCRPRDVSAQPSFLPGMPSPEDLGNSLAAEATQYRECRNGHLYLVGDCGEHNYTQKAMCPECGAQIGGGSGSKQVTAERLSARLSPNNGFCLPPPPAGGGLQATPPLRNLPPAGVALSRALLAAVLLVGRATALCDAAGEGREAWAACYEALLSKAAAPTGSGLAPEELFARHFEAAVAALCDAASLQSDEAIMLLHRIIEALAGADAALAADCFASSAGRDAWEAALWAVVEENDMLGAATVEENDARCKEALGDGTGSLLRTELMERDEGRPEDGALRNMWRFRAHASIVHFERALTALPAPAETHQVLSAVLSRRHLLRAVAWLPRAVRLQEKVLRLLTAGDQQGQSETSDSTVGALLCRLPERERDTAHADLEAFGAALAAVRDGRAVGGGGEDGDGGGAAMRSHLPHRLQLEISNLHAQFGGESDEGGEGGEGGEGRAAFESYLPASISLDSPALWFSPSERGVGALALALNLALVGVNNEFLRRARASPAQQRAVPVTLARAHHICGIGDEQELLRIVRRCAGHDFRYGHGTEVEHDLDTAEKEVHGWAVCGRRDVDVGSVLAMARRHRRAVTAATSAAGAGADFGGGGGGGGGGLIVSAATLAALRAAVPQSALDSTTQRAVLAELAARGDILRAQGTLETAISYLAAVGCGDPTLPLREFLERALLMAPSNCLISAEAASSEVGVRNVESLWWALDVHAAVARARGPDGARAIFGGREPPQCLACELDEGHRALLRAALERGGDAFRGLLLGALRRCGTARLCGDESGHGMAGDLLQELDWPLPAVLAEYACADSDGAEADMAAQQLGQLLAVREAEHPLRLRHLVLVFAFVAEA